MTTYSPSDISCKCMWGFLTHVVSFENTPLRQFSNFQNFELMRIKKNNSWLYDGSF